MIRLAASLSLTHLLVVARRRTLYLVSGLATILSLAAFATVLLLADILNHRDKPIIVTSRVTSPSEFKFWGAFWFFFGLAYYWWRPPASPY